MIRIGKGQTIDLWDHEAACAAKNPHGWRVERHNRGLMVALKSQMSDC